LQRLRYGRLRPGVVRGALARLLVRAVGHVEDPSDNAGSDEEWAFTRAEHVGYLGRFWGWLWLVWVLWVGWYGCFGLVGLVKKCGSHEPDSGEARPLLPVAQR
jgi:hypothetical protein